MIQEEILIVLWNGYSYRWALKNQINKREYTRNHIPNNLGSLATLKYGGLEGSTRSFTLQTKRNITNSVHIGQISHITYWNFRLLT